jgi:ribosome-binding factor A
VTITDVATTNDLREATVYVSVYGDEESRRETLAALGGAHGVLQAKINRELHLRRTPTLTFAYDPSVERGVRMTQLIDELAPDESNDGE